MSQPVVRAARRSVRPAADRELAAQLRRQRALPVARDLEQGPDRQQRGRRRDLPRPGAILRAGAADRAPGRPDRRRPVLIVANAVTGAGVLSLLLVHDRQQLRQMHAVAVGYGASFAAIGPAPAGPVKDLLPGKDLAGANAASVTARGSPRGPAPACTRDSAADPWRSSTPPVRHPSPCPSRSG